MPRVYVVGGDYLVEDMYKNEGWSVVNSWEWAVSHKDELDLVQFCGGEDVCPDFYGETATAYVCHTNRARDMRELGIYTWALSKDICMTGICRGGQFLNVMNGGALWQHANNHAIGGTHLAHDYMWNKTVEVTSTHHQVMRPNMDRGDCVILADCALSTIRIRDKLSENFTQNKSDVEVVFYGDTNVLCFQPHPEYSGFLDECRRYYFDLLDEFLYLRAKENAIHKVTVV